MGFTKYIYNRVFWRNKSESLDTPLGQTLLNRMDSAIYNIAENLNVIHEDLSTGKFDKADAGKVIVGMPTWNPNTGILTFQFYDGAQFSVDFNVEKIPVSFSMDSAGVITMTTSDGTEWTANIGDVVPDYTFKDSDRIAFSRTKNANGSYTVSADIKKGSIAGEHLQSNYLADITAQAFNAAASAKSASDSADDADFDAKLAQSYAVGGSGVRQGEDSDNAKKYKEQCQAIYDDFRQAGSVTGVKGAVESEYRHGNVNITPENIGAAPYATVNGGDFNEMTVPGIYTMRGSNTNAPTTGSYHSLIVLRSDSGVYVQQMAIQEGTRDVYVRYGSNGTWGDWGKLMAAGDTAVNSAMLGGHTSSWFEEGRWILHRETINLNYYTSFGVDTLSLKGNSIEIGQHTDVVVLGVTNTLCWLAGWSYSGLTLSINVVTHNSNDATATVCYMTRG